MQKLELRMSHNTSDDSSFNILQPIPPVYHAGNVTTPVALFSGGNDWLSDPSVSKVACVKIPFLPLANSFAGR